MGLQFSQSSRGMGGSFLGIRTSDLWEHDLRKMRVELPLRVWRCWAFAGYSLNLIGDSSAVVQGHFVLRISIACAAAGGAVAKARTAWVARPVAGSLFGVAKPLSEFVEVIHGDFLELRASGAEPEYQQPDPPHQLQMPASRYRFFQHTQRR